MEKNREASLASLEAELYPQKKTAFDFDSYDENEVCKAILEKQKELDYLNQIISRQK